MLFETDWAGQTREEIQKWKETLAVAKGKALIHCWRKLPKTNCNPTWLGWIYSKSDRK